MAVLDTGIDERHPDFAGRIDSSSQSFAVWRGLEDHDGHGTYIAGIIAGDGQASNGLYRGLAPAAQLIIYKIAHSRKGAASTAAAAVAAAIEAGADIINYSHGISPRELKGDPPWVWPSHRSLIEDAFELATSRGIVCTVAAGNEGPSHGSITSPGILDCVLTVGATTFEDRVLDMSSRGPVRRCDNLRAGGVTRYDPAFHQNAHVIRRPSVVAPGDGISAPQSSYALKDSTDDPYYQCQNGTSPAAAIVAGVAALLLELAAREHVDLGPNRGRTISRLIERSAQPLAHGSEVDFGSGVILWPALQATLQDFARDAQFRASVLADSPLRLL